MQLTQCSQKFKDRFVAAKNTPLVVRLVFHRFSNWKRLQDLTTRWFCICLSSTRKVSLSLAVSQVQKSSCHVSWQGQSCMLAAQRPHKLNPPPSILKVPGSASCCDTHTLCRTLGMHADGDTAMQVTKDGVTAKGMWASAVSLRCILCERRQYYI